MVKVSRSLKRNTFWLLGSLCLVGSSTYLWVAIQSLKLRPIADDYCFAAQAGEGLFSATKFWWLTWSGDVVSMFISSAITGWPIVFLKWSVGSAFAFMLSALSLSLVLYLLITEIVTLARNYKWILAASMSVFVPIAWWSFWWITPLLAPASDETLTLPRAITFWQTINTGYVITTSIAVVCFLAVNRIPRRFALTLMFSAGLLAGLSGPVLAISLITLALFTLIWLFKFNSAEMSRKKNYFAYIMGGIIGLASAMLSPGTQARRSVFLQNPTIPDLDLIDLLWWTFRWMFPQTLWEFMVAILGLGTILVTLFFGAIGFILSHNVKISDFTIAKYRVTQLLTLALLLTTFSQISEAFSYSAFWHLVPIYMLIFVLAVYGSFIIGIKIGKGIKRRAPRFVAVLLIATQVAMVLSVLEMGAAIGSRYDSWSKGAAPLYGIGDIESNPGWIWDCWNNIGKFRDLPDRS